MSSPSAKNVPLPFFRTMWSSLAIPPPHEGRIAIVTDVGRGMRWTLGLLSARTKAILADGKGVWSWPPVAGVKPEGDNIQVTEAIKAGLRGERAISRKTIVQGMPACFGVPVVTNSRVFCFTRGYGCGQHPAFPAPSPFEGRERCITWALRAAGMRKCVSDPPLVIPGRASWREPGIHIHDHGYGFRACALRIPE